MRIAIVTGSTRPNRNNIAVARWVFELAATRRDATFELVDIADYHLPLLDEPLPPALGRYTHPHTKRWAAKIASFDGYVFVTPEYNHGTSAALKNAIDYLYAEWNHKAAGFVELWRRRRGAGRRTPADGDGQSDGGRCDGAGDALTLHRLREHVGVSARPSP
jgi:NAD(P)H-dependent FMN reductase